MRTKHHNFEVGDLVVLKGCTGHQVVTSVGRTTISTRYPSSGYVQKHRAANDFEFYDQPEKEPKTMTTKLYQTVTEPQLYGTFLAKDPQGRLLLEMKPDNSIKAFATDEVEPVIPYTIKIGNTHVIAPKDKFQKGDVLLAPNGEIVSVKAVDTKFEDAAEMPLTKFRRILTEAIA